MKKFLVFIFIIICAFNCNAQELNTSQDSIKVFYDELFSILENEYLYKDNVNWKEIEPKVRKNLKEYSDFNCSLDEVASLFNLINADHCKVYYNQNTYSGNFETPTQKDFSEQWVKKYSTEPNFEVKVLDNEYGYILMPGMMFEDVSSKNIHKLSQPMYDEIYNIKSSKNIKGWIIDLRFNTGGNITPMLLALYDFLGDNDVWGVLDINKKKVTNVKLSNGKYINNSKKSSYIKPKGMLLDEAKVAIITNLATGSSGEVTALAFKGRKNVNFIGEKTNGKTTTNTLANLPFGAYMALTVGYDCDRNGNFYEQIIPDVKVSKQDNFENLLLDRNIQEAIEFISRGE